MSEPAATDEVVKAASTAVPLHPLLADRWSPRSFDPAHQLSTEHLLALLEAARWAPSANNSQPWRFVVGLRGSVTFDRLHHSLDDGNKVWAGSASALILVAAETVGDSGRRHRHAEYDTGQAVAQLVAQACAEGLAVHQMGGFDGSSAATAVELPGGLTPLVVVAVGRRRAELDLPEHLAARERAPRARLPIEQLLLGAALETRSA